MTDLRGENPMRGARLYERVSGFQIQERWATGEVAEVRLVSVNKKCYIQN